MCLRLHCFVHEVVHACALLLAFERSDWNAGIDLAVDLAGTRLLRIRYKGRIQLHVAANKRAFDTPIMSRRSAVDPYFAARGLRFERGEVLGSNRDRAPQ